MLSKPHIVNVIFLLVTAVLLLMNMHQCAQYRRWERAYYDFNIEAFEYHPVNYVVDIVTRHGDVMKYFEETEESTYWGCVHSSSFKDLIFKSLPDSLKVSYYSLRERKAYGGAFRFSAATLDSLYQLNSHKRMYSPGKWGYNFGIGIGLDGNISVWAQGASWFQKEIAHFKAREISVFNNLTGQALIDYISDPDRRNNNSQYLDSLLDNKVSPDTAMWHAITQRYPYYIYLSAGGLQGVIDIEFINGEMNRFDFSKKSDYYVNTGPPKRLLSVMMEEEASYTDSSMISWFKEKTALLQPTDTLEFTILASRYFSIDYDIKSCWELSLEPREW